MTEDIVFTNNQIADDESRRQFAFNLMQAFKLNNIAEGLTGVQALWLHHRARAWVINYGGLAMTVDLINMAYSGDCETVYLALATGTADDMSQPYHAWSQARIDKLKLAVAKYLGWA